MAQADYGRRYDIDWLRTLAFGVLILYHTGMYYVADWGWHIKSEHTFAWLQDVMMLTVPWRMSLLFFISAIALALVGKRYSGGSLAILRSKRLLVPLLFGMFVIVAPQTYYEALSQNLIQPGFLSFWLQYINPHTELLKEHHSVIGLLTWNHLWYLPYLWVYSLIVLALSGVLQALAATRVFQHIPAWIAAAGAVLALMIIWFLLRQRFPVTHALLDDWYSHGKYFLVFVSGYLFALQPHWWSAVIRQRRGLLLLAVLGYAFLIADRHELLLFLSSRFETSDTVRAFYGLVVSLEHWAWLLAAVGYAGFWLNRPGRLLDYANHAVLPWYMLHQTLIIVFAWWLKSASLPGYAEAPVLLILTVLGCLAGYEVIRRSRILSWLCGLKLAAGQKSGRTTNAIRSPV